jgi:hypothetical protein
VLQRPRHFAKGHRSIIPTRNPRAINPSFVLNRVVCTVLFAYSIILNLHEQIIDVTIQQIKSLACNRAACQVCSHS